MGNFSSRNASIVGSRMNGSKFFADIPKLKSIADEIIAIGKI